MQKLFNSIVRQIESPVCLRCGSYRIHTNYFCLICTNNFLCKKLGPPRLEVFDNIEVYSFICWLKNESDCLSELIYLLKTRSSEQAWAWFVDKLESEICTIIDPHPGTVLISVPGSKKSFHTDYFSGQVEKLTGCRLIKPMYKMNVARPQKLKTAAERKGTEFAFNEEFTDIVSTATKIYLIDDIVTTGATLKNISDTIRRAIFTQNVSGAKITGITLFYRQLTA